MNRRNRRVRLAVEQLEPRYAPASTLAYVDGDGDMVTITSSKGDLTNRAAFNSIGVGQQLTTLDLTGAAFQGADIAFAVTRASSGDGLAAVGRINAIGTDLGNVVIKGDLGNIDCGDADTGTAALAMLKVRSMGRYGLATQGGGGDLTSAMNGALGSLKVGKDIKEAFLSVSGDIGSVTIGGSLIGGSSIDSGVIRASGDIGPVQIGQHLQGGTGINSGRINSSGKISTVTIGGSLIGGSSSNSGQINSNGDLGAVTVGHNVQGGAGGGSGFIGTNGKLASVTIGGSILGGQGTFSGGILSQLDIGPVMVGRDITGGGAMQTGFVQATTGNIAMVSVAGSLLGGLGVNSGVIRCGGTALGAVRIGHDMLGLAASSGVISSKGTIASLTIGGSLGGGDGDASGLISCLEDIGKVKIGHDLFGGIGARSGVISTVGRIVKFNIGGSLIGGVGEDSGSVSAVDALDVVKIRHDVLGGSATRSGSIQTGPIGSLVIGGSLVGGTATSTGVISAEGRIGTVTIGHDVIGGSIGEGAASTTQTGCIESFLRIESIVIGGSIIAGIDGSAVGELTRNASIRALTIGSLTVQGSLVGNVSTFGDSFATISVVGLVNPGSAGDLALGTLTVGGRVEFAQVYAGYDLNLNPTNADAQIGSVFVGGDWVSSSMIAGAINLGEDDAIGGVDANADNVNFGDIHDSKITEGFDDANVISTIRNINIAGQVFGTPDSFSNHVSRFGFVAEKISALSINGGAVALQAGPNNDGLVLGRTKNMRLHEIDAEFLTTQVSPGSAKRVSATTVTYTDIDGDHVTVTLSKPLLTAANVNTVFTFDKGSVNGPNVNGQQLQMIDLATLNRDGLSLTIHVTPGGGDRRANVGYIRAVGVNVGDVVVSGDLGQIDAGTFAAGATAIRSLSVRSLGRLDVDTQPEASATFSPDLLSELRGNVGSITVKQDVVSANVSVFGILNSLNIRGSLIGGGETNSGLVSAARFGNVVIGGDVQGGSGDQSGVIASLGKIASVSIGGSLLGGTGRISGRLASEENIGTVTIAHNLRGGTANRAGHIEGHAIAGVVIGGSQLGGPATFSGTIITYDEDLGPVSIGHNVVGGGAESGKIDAGKNFTSLVIGGSLIGGAGDYSSITDDNGIQHYAQVFAVESMGPVTIGRNILGGAGLFGGSIKSRGNMASATVGGSLIGGANLAAGVIESRGVLGAVQIGHNLVGRAGNAGGCVIGDSGIVSVALGGSLIGGTESSTGQIFSRGVVGPVTIGQNLLGGTKVFSGGILVGLGNLKRVTIDGSFVGGSATGCGLIAGDRIGAVSIGGDLIGGSISGSAGTLDQTGYIQSRNRIGSVSVGGSIIAGIDTSTGGSLTKNASIRAGKEIDSINVIGSLVGNVTSLVIISAHGLDTSAPVNVAIGNLNIGGRVERANILAGYGLDLIPDNDGVQISAVTVGQDWIASNLVAGVRNLGADDAPGGFGVNADNVNYGDSHDAVLGLGNIANRIDSVMIRGVVVGSADSNTDHFGFSSVRFGFFKAGGFTAPLTANSDIIELALLTGDTTIREQ